MIVLALMAAAAMTLRADHPDLSRAEAEAMTPAALGDALLAPGHQPIVAVTWLPQNMAPPLPPGSPVRLWVRLTSAAMLDTPSGFCVRHSVEVRTVRRGATQSETSEPATDYRLPDPTRDRCGGRFPTFFSLLPSDQPRGFAVVRLLAAAVADARRRRPSFPITVDDRLNRDMAQWLAANPDQRRPGDADYVEVTDGRAALASLSGSAVSYVGHDLYDSDLISPELSRQVTRAGAHPSERWAAVIGDWTADLMLEGDRIVAMALRRQIPPPF